MLRNTTSTATAPATSTTATTSTTTTTTSSSTTTSTKTTRTVPFEQVFVARAPGYHPDLRTQEEGGERSGEGGAEGYDVPRVASEEEYVTCEIQTALDQGLDVVLTPGIYHLTRALR